MAKYELSDMEPSERAVLQCRCVGGTKFFSERKWFDKVFKRLQEIVGVGNKAHQKSLRWFLSCTSKAIRHKGIGFMYSRDPAWFSATKQGIGYKNSIKILDFLEKEGYIDLYNGFVGVWARSEDGAGFIPDECHTSIVVMNQKYLDLWRDLDVKKMPTLEDMPLIVVRDRKTKEEITLKGLDGVVQMRALVERLNNKLAETEIKLDEKVCASVQYNRIFSDDLEQDGRFYVVGGGVQTAPALLRKTSLYIDEDKTVELDFKAMHPNLLLELMSVGARKEGTEFGVSPDFSPYDVDLTGLIELDQDEIAKMEDMYGCKYDPVRNLKKQALLVMINAKSEAAARGALCQKIATDKRRPDILDRLFVGIKGSLPIKEIMDRIYDHNEIIAHHMYNDTGIALMNMDSRIAERVIDAMLQENEPILCYHDSFIVKHYMEDYLRLSMENAWKAVMRDNKFCKIEKKG